MRLAVLWGIVLIEALALLSTQAMAQGETTSFVHRFQILLACGAYVESAGLPGPFVFCLENG
jgi:hypothetical protein